MVQNEVVASGTDAPDGVMGSGTATLPDQQGRAHPATAAVMGGLGAYDPDGAMGLDAAALLDQQGRAAVMGGRGEGGVVTVGPPPWRHIGARQPIAASLASSTRRRAGSTTDPYHDERAQPYGDYAGPSGFERASFFDAPAQGCTPPCGVLAT